VDLIEGSSDGLELSLKLYHAGELQLGYQQLMTEAPREIKNPKTSFMACLSAAVVGSMQGNWMRLYREQEQKEQQQREAEQRTKLEETVKRAEFFVARLEQHRWSMD
jgi:5-methylthioribose kinase